MEGLGCVPSGQGAGVFSVQSSPGEAHVCELSGVPSLASEPRDRISGVSPGGSPVESVSDRLSPSPSL